MDLDGDGKQDIVAAFAQHHEDVIAWFGKGSANYERKELFKANHPNWGINRFAVADLDGDGDKDIVVVNGDGMDDGVPWKPYHGVSWLRNEGGRRFVHQRIGNAYAAAGLAVADVDGDGDQDVLVSAWLADPAAAGARRPKNVPGVAWFAQVSPGTFEPATLVANLLSTPALLVADIDGKPGLELVTGRFAFQAPPDAAGKPLETLDIWRIANVPGR